MPPLAKTQGVFGRLLPPATGKAGALRARLIRKLAQSTALIGILCGVMVAAAVVEDQLLSRYNALDGEVKKLSANISTMVQKTSDARRLQPVFDQLVAANGGPHITLDRRSAEDILSKTQSDFVFPSLHAAISLAQDVKAPDYKNSFVTATQCDITLAFDAVSDEHVMEFLRRLRGSLPGALRITDMKMSRTGEVTDKTIQDIARTGKTALVKADVKMSWMGMDEATKDKPDAPAPAATAPPATPAAPAAR